ncbi:MAG: septation protein SepH [Arachnia sp.]
MAGTVTRPTDEEPMDNAFSPREIQARIRSGASISDIVSESGLDAARVEAFAGPVLAEREHIANSARTSTVRRRGESGSHRKLGDLIAQRLRARGIDDDLVTWDAWRQADLKWRVLATLPGELEDRKAEFVYDAKGRFSVADNTDARWMIGEEQVGARPEEENTVDLHDELALVRAVTEPVAEAPGEEVPSSDLMHDGNEDTSQLDRLYDMLSGISEDSVRIYTGIFEETVVEAELETTTDVFEDEPEPAPAPEPVAVSTSGPATPAPAEPTQEALVEGEPPAPKPRARKKRAQVPSWDEIMFGGPTT